ncbi:MAG: sigma-54-dependent transcriptional regulator [Planctomycetota bacterium]|jgi:DNA-binding NtrC family response regulator
MSEQDRDAISQIVRKDDIANVLIVENDTNTARFILEILAHKGIRGHLVSDEKTALDFLEKSSCDLVFTSQTVPKQHVAKRHSGETRPEFSEADSAHGYYCRPESGFELIHKICETTPELPVIMIGKADPSELSLRSSQDAARNKKAKTHLQEQILATAVKAVREGCYEFLTRPLDRNKIETLLDTLLPNHGVSTMASAHEDTHCLYRIVGRSTRMAQIVCLAKKVAPTSVSVLISGESGTGKELISYLVHHNSRRAEGPYVKVNCAALSNSLLESELFGHEKGAFTGAYAQRKGRFETAHGGTLLLDEISETPPKFQAKLLRVLEQQDFERVGGNENVRVNVRIISTTNKDLLQEVREGRFRQDLYYRLCGVRLVLPPLRERKQDLPDLVWHFVNLYAREVLRHVTELDPLMMDIFGSYHWPGNVRQLRNVVRTSLSLGVGQTLSLADVSWLFDELSPLPQENQNEFVKVSDEAETPQGGLGRPWNRCREAASENVQNRQLGFTRPRNDQTFSLGGVPLEQIERKAILDTLEQTAGNQTKAAKVLGISDRTLRCKIRRYREQGCLQLTP